MSPATSRIQNPAGRQVSAERRSFAVCVPRIQASAPKQIIELRPQPNRVLFGPRTQRLTSAFALSKQHHLEKKVAASLSLATTV
jgi:hypothetical protein